MKAVSRFEYNLLRILHCFLGRVPLEQVMKEVVPIPGKERPTCLSRAAVELVQDALAKGCVTYLARVGGWRRERFLRDDKPQSGRLWERTSPSRLGLTFTGCTLDFLMWITGVKPLKPKGAWQPPQEPSVGDMLVTALAYSTMRSSGLAPTMPRLQELSGNGLCRLLYPEDFAGSDAIAPTDFGPWTTEPGSFIVEALQPELFRRWLDVEQSKGDIIDWQKMRRQGQAQQQVLDGFLTAVEQAGRRDLARFLLRVLGVVLDGVEHSRDWVGGLQSLGPRMAEREETHRAALALVSQMERFRVWQRQARLDGPFDETFARSQLWLADWERFHGEVLDRRAREIVRQLDPMRQT